MEEIPNIIACVPCVEGMQMGYVPYKDAIIVKCSQCNCRVWLGPESKKAHVELKAPIWCMKCVAIEFGEEAKDNIQVLSDKKMGE